MKERIFHLLPWFYIHLKIFLPQNICPTSQVRDKGPPLSGPACKDVVIVQQTKVCPLGRLLLS